MGSKVKQRTVVNQKTSQATLTVNERILKECHQLYADPDNGLVEVGLSLFGTFCQGNLLGEIDSKAVRRWSFLSNTQFIRKQSGSKLQF